MWVYKPDLQKVPESIGERTALMSEVPQNRNYLSSHEWAMPEDDGHVVVGITEFAASELGELVYIELPEIGSEVHFDQQFGEIESVKAVSALNSPLNGTVVEINSALVESQDAISETPYDAGWMMKIKPAEDSGMDQLLSPQDYESQLSE